MRFLFKLFYLLLMFTFLSGCAISAVHPSLTAGNGMPDLIPVRDFVANRASNFSYQISPDGKKLAWIAVKGVSLHIFIKTLETGAIQTIPAAWYGFNWAQDSRHLVTTCTNPDETSYVLTLDTESPDFKQKIITPESGVKAHIVRRILNDPDHLLIEHNQRDKSVFDLFRININTKEQILLAENPGNVIQWLTTPKGELNGRIVKQGNANVLELRQSPEAGYKAVYRWSIDDAVQVVGMAGQGASIYLLSNKGRDRMVLIELSGESGKETILHADTVVDVSYALTHPVTGKPIVAVSYPDYQKTTLLDPSFAVPFNLFNKKTPVNINIDSFDNQLNRMTVTLSTDKGYDFLFYDMKANALQLLGSHPNLDNMDSLSDITPIEFTSRDNVPLRGYLALPRGVTPRRLPLVLKVHGGPWGRDGWGYNSEIQFLTNRGYAVLEINYRGSTGYGRNFQELAIGEFAGKMHNDLLDGVNWAVEKGIADPARIAITGTSYGGYAALVGLSFTPEIFACGIDINGPTDLEKLVTGFPVDWKLHMNHWYKYAGDPEKEADRANMRAKSPLFKVDNITKPLMVIQGAEDVRVLKEQSIELVRKLEEAGKEVDFWLVPGAGHGLTHWPLRLKQFRKTEDFLARCLGGRSSGFDFYQLGAWLF